MQPATDTPNEDADDHEGAHPDAAAAAVAQIAAHELRQTQERAEFAMLSPLDQAMRRPLQRPHAQVPSIWDADKPLQAPSISLDPGNITGDPLYFEEEHAGLLGGAVNAMTAMRDAVAKTIAAREAIKGDPTQTEAAKVLAIDALNTRLSQAALPKVDQALAHIERSIAESQAAIKAPIKAHSTSPVAAEIRAYVRGLKASDRMTLLTTAINDGDAVTAGALLGGTPAYLGGLDAGMVESLTQTWNTKRDPVQARRLAVLEAARVKLIRANGQFQLSLQNAVGATHTTVAKLRDQQKATRAAIGAIA